MDRGAALDEALELLQRLLRGKAVHFHGRHFVVDTNPLLPMPSQDPLPIWGACRWPHRPPLARAARLQGCFPIFPSDGPPPPPPPADIITVRSMLADLGARPDIDLVVRCTLSLEDAASVPDTVSALEQAGVTWLLEGFGPGEPPAAVVEMVVGEGPPGGR